MRNVVLTLAATAALALGSCHAEATPMQDPNLTLAADQSEIIVKGEATDIEPLVDGNYRIDALTEKPTRLKKGTAAVRVLRRIKGDVGETISVAFFISGIRKTSVPKKGEVALMFLSRVDGSLVGSDCRNWKFPAVARPASSQPAEDVKGALVEEMLALLRGSDEKAALLAMDQLGFILEHRPAAPEVRPFLHHRSQMLRFGAARALICLHDYEGLPEVWKVLAEPLESQDTELLKIRVTADWSIDDLGRDPKATPYLVELLESDADWLRGRAASCFMGTRRNHLISALRSSKRGTRLTALKALADAAGDAAHAPREGMTDEEEAALIAYWLSSQPPLISNGGFEEAIDMPPGVPPKYWGGSMRKGGTFAIDTSVAHSGKQSIRLQTKAEGDTASVNTVVALPLRCPVRLSGYYRTAGLASARDMRLVLVSYGPLADGRYVREGLTVQPSEGQWAYFEKVLSLPPSDQARARVDFDLLQGPGSLWLDDVVMTAE